MNPHSYGRAISGRCRCDDCRPIKREYERQYAKMRREGVTSWVDAEPCRQHVRSLMGQGMGWMVVAEHAGVGQATVSRLLYGGSGRMHPTRRVHVMTARRILSVTNDLDNFRDRSLVDSTISVRKVQALIACGWSISKLAMLLGVQRQHLHVILNKPQITAGRARDLRALYRALWDKEPPLVTGRDKQVYSRTVALAEDKGYRRPTDWVDIEDPNELPALDVDEDFVDEVAVQRVLDGWATGASLTRPEKQELVRRLVKRDVSLKGAAARASLSLRYAQEAVA